MSSRRRAARSFVPRLGKPRGSYRELSRVIGGLVGCLFASDYICVGDLLIVDTLTKLVQVVV